MEHRYLQSSLDAPDKLYAAPEKGNVFRRVLALVPLFDYAPYYQIHS